MGQQAAACVYDVLVQFQLFAVVPGSGLGCKVGG